MIAKERGWHISWTSSTEKKAAGSLESVEAGAWTESGSTGGAKEAMTTCEKEGVMPAWSGVPRGMPRAALEAAPFAGHGGSPGAEGLPSPRSFATPGGVAEGMVQPVAPRRPRWSAAAGGSSVTRGELQGALKGGPAAPRRLQDNATAGGSSATRGELHGTSSGAEQGAASSSPAAGVARPSP